MQECIRYNKLIDIMEQSLPELQKALKGLVVMSGELEAVGKAIALNAVPESWEAKVKPRALPAWQLRKFYVSANSSASNVVR